MKNGYFETSRRDFLKASVMGGAATLTALKVPSALAQPTPPTPQPPFTHSDPANSPMGTAFGVKPGRVSWAFDPKATSWDGVTNAPGWWDDSNTHPEPVAAMLSGTIRSVGDAPPTKMPGTRSSSTSTSATARARWATRRARRSPSR